MDLLQTFDGIYTKMVQEARICEKTLTGATSAQDVVQLLTEATKQRDERFSETFTIWVHRLEHAGSADAARVLMGEYVEWRRKQELPLNDAYRFWIAAEDVTADGGHH